MILGIIAFFIGVMIGVAVMCILYVARDRADKKPVQIPTPHGRLIDADRLIEYINKELKGDEYIQRMFRRIVKSRPTIIEAEVE